MPADDSFVQLSSYTRIPPPNTQQHFGCSTFLAAGFNFAVVKPRSHYRCFNFTERIMMPRFTMGTTRSSFRSIDLINNKNTDARPSASSEPFLDDLKRFILATIGRISI
jgi:hypothetical protein